MIRSLLVRSSLLVRCLCAVWPLAGGFTRYAAGSDGSKTSPIANTEEVIPGRMRSFMRRRYSARKPGRSRCSPSLGHTVLLRDSILESVRGSFLILATHLCSTGRELMTLASPGGVLRVSKCERSASPAAHPGIPDPG